MLAFYYFLLLLLTLASFFVSFSLLPGGNGKKEELGKGGCLFA
jgi:hypothetical protein